MLRTYKPLDSHDIFIYQQHVEHLICNVWCSAEAGIKCQDLLTEEFEKIYLKRAWIKEDVDEIYELCKPLTKAERADIKEAFVINNDIDSLCEGKEKPRELYTLAAVVASKMKPLLVKFYNDLIGANEKLSYYNDLIIHNGDFKFCLCCGIVPVESAESHYREDNDHYLPKAEYPFSSVNFKNLPPLCGKCNKKCKSTNNPFENGRKSFYAFKPLENEFEITVSIKAAGATSYLALKQSEVVLNFNNNPDKVATWAWLFQIDSRYNEEIRQFSKTELRILANRFKRNDERKKGETYEQILKDALDDYEIDKYDDRKFLKRSFLREMLNKPDWMGVYDQLLAL
ncbi:hypothetical protein [uncultured Mucilaginibacter sp.]|uniref:hypothetical protein n=1 Tax=uncultured Mucilaginibacter sp. TaxID=797541 RepID=UPI0025EC45F3|nr:hypothetical protein [uncultured Mucilaginibacter sp.]